MVTPRTTHPVLRLAKIMAGLVLLGLGFVGLFLPVLQGVLFMLAGLALLATESRRVRRLMVGIRRRHPGPWRHARDLKHRMSAWVRAGTRKTGEEASGDEG
ncbi:MAG: hypothetical protein ACE5JI_04725, partial [Acidobacteriota bacterium]